ncbi:MAG: ABC transporter ATP-binding protein/permease [Defluviitaleaceae bacterium]|nr:ABC transporter ATP-binding protein/permease [Defluviitaleaceae bacterium]
MLSNEVSRILRPLHGYRFAVIFVSGLHILAGLLPPYLMSLLIDDLYPYINEYAAFVFTVGSIAGVLIACFFLDWLQGYMWANLINNGAGIVRSFFFENVLHKNYRFFLNNPVGDINNKVLNDSYIYVQSKLMMMPTLFLNILHILVIFGFLFALNVYMKLMTIAFSLVFFLAYSQINRYLRKSAVKERESFSTLMAESNVTLTGIDTIQIYAAEHYVAGYFERLVDAYEHKLSKLKYWQTLSKASTNIITNIIPVAAIVAGIFYLSRGGNISIGSIMAFYYLLPRLKDPIKALTDFNIDIQNAKAVELRLEELLVKDAHDHHGMEKVEAINEIEFRNLGFSYPDGGETILENLNVKLVRGDSLAIVGPSGTGKTTLMRLLMRQVDPGEGEILVNGRSCTETDPASYLARVAVLPQDVFIFDSTIHDNISFAKDYREKRIRDVARLSCLDHFSMDENALGLSSGERQRLGLARALACDYDVLILDEPTSNLDSETECAIIENLREAQRSTNCIMIVVTHSANVLEKLCTKELVLAKH